jgi:L-alanine-DL-glutamate epimerase-like enolase superfamily enzyme
LAGEIQHMSSGGIALATSVHLSAALQDCIVVELDYTYNPLGEELLQAPFTVRNGYLFHQTSRAWPST